MLPVERSSSIQSVTQNLLKEIFPEEKYKTAGEKMTLHFLIALGQPNSGIIQWIKKKPTYLNHKDKAYLQLTPLAVCVLKGNKEIAKILIEDGADPTIGDHKAWTPFHHAAITDTSMLDLLLIRKFSPIAHTLLNSENGSYRHLIILTSTQFAPIDSQVFYLREGVTVSKQTAKKFRELTNAIYCHSVYISSEELIRKWKTKKIEVIQSLLPPQCLKTEYERCRHNPYKISIGKIDNASQGYDVFAEETISPFHGIALYGGNFKNQSTNVDYYLEDIDGENVRNIGPMINDGFPNCTCEPIIVGGFRYFLFLSIQEIKPGEKLYWNYGATHRVKLDIPHLELNKEKLLNYVDCLPEKLQFLLKTDPRKISNLALLNYLADKERISYLLQTPSSLFYLLSQNRFPIEAMVVLFDNKFQSLPLKLGLNQDKFDTWSLIAKMCSSIHFVLQQEPFRDIHSEVRAILLQWSSTLPMSLIMNCTAFFANSILRVKSEENWNIFKQDLGSYILFMEAIHYYCSEDKTIKHFEFLPKLKDHFLLLGNEKRKEVLGFSKECLSRLDEERQKNLANCLNELQNL